MEVIEAGFLCSSKISAIRNSKFRVVIETLIALIVRKKLYCFSVHERNTTSKDLKYWLTLPIRSILNLESVKWAIILLNITLKSVKDFKTEKGYFIAFNKSKKSLKQSSNRLDLFLYDIGTIDYIVNDRKWFKDD